jgi:hypothetical protein
VEEEMILQVGDDGNFESPNIKEKIRVQLQDDIAAYLQRGGIVKQIDQDVRADPPRKPDSTYGSNPT